MVDQVGAIVHFYFMTSARAAGTYCHGPAKIVDLTAADPDQILGFLAGLRIGRLGKS
jgi:hypothetical protein